MVSPIVLECWVWFALTLVVVVARTVSRRMLHGSFRELQIDDYLMVVVMVFFTILLVGVKILTHTPTNLIDPADKTVVLTPESVKERVFGSKMVVVVEQMQVQTIWGTKACLLILYSRLTMTLKHNILVKIVAGYVALGWLAMEICFFAAWCRPFHHYWKVPTEDHFMIICLPMPVFLQAQLQPKRKVILCSVFALGLFTIISAILSKYYSFSETYGTHWIYWYIRETATAIIVANLPLTWTLLQRMFTLGSFNGKSSRRTGEATSRFRSAYGNLTSRTRDERAKKEPKDADLSPSESQEHINQAYGIPLKIYQQNEVHITTEEVATKDGRQTPQETSPTGITFAANEAQRLAMHSEQQLTGELDMGNVTTAYRGQ